MERRAWSEQTPSSSRRTIEKRPSARKIATTEGEEEKTLEEGKNVSEGKELARDEEDGPAKASVVVEWEPLRALKSRPLCLVDPDSVGEDGKALFYTHTSWHPISRAWFTYWHYMHDGQWKRAYDQCPFHANGVQQVTYSELKRKYKESAPPAGLPPVPLM